MSNPNLPISEFLIKSEDRQDRWKKTSWGEGIRLLIGSGDTAGLFSLFDFEAPAHFGPPRHYHLDDVEAITVTSGKLVVWTTRCSFVAGPGDTIHFPKQMEHAWKAVGDEPIRLRVLMSPGKLESFFDLAVEQALSIDDGPGMAAAAEAVGIVVTGPPLTNDEAQSIITST